MDIISYNGRIYPKHVSIGNASQFAIAFARHYCKGVGVDIGFCKEEWKFPGAIGADLSDNSNNYHAFNLPDSLDYIYSSHCLEHIENWVDAIEYWSSRLKTGGVLFLYLPHRDQEYWNPWNLRKHIHVLDSDMVTKCMNKFNIQNVFSSERDLNYSFIVVGQKL